MSNILIFILGALFGGISVILFTILNVNKEI